jgi:transposase
MTVVADRGMISKKTINELEAREMKYILGARMRSQKEVKEEVLSRAGAYRMVTGPRDNSKDPSPLKVKEVTVDGRRYVVCLNMEQAIEDAKRREQILEGLRKAMKSGDKGLVGNKGFRMFLKSAGGFEIDEEKVKQEARYDGKWVLRTNHTKEELSAEEVALRYKDLWMVEDTFRSLKSVLSTRPVWHKRDETIRGHVFASFLALVLLKELLGRMKAAGHAPEWRRLKRDLVALEETTVETKAGRSFLLRSDVKGDAGKALQAAGVAIPPRVRQAS